MTRKSLGMLAIVTGTGLVFRLYGLGRHGLWFDEAYSVFVAKLQLNFSFEVLISDSVHPPLYYLLQRVALPLGESEAVVRLPALLFGLLAIPLMHTLGKTWTGGRVALIAAALAALSPFHIWYSQEARMYSTLMMFSVVSMITYGGLLRSDRRRRISLAFVLSSGLAYLTHYFALFLPLVQLVHIGINFKRFHRILTRWALLQLLAATPFFIWLWMVYRQPEVFIGIGWINEPRLADLWYTLINLSVGFVEQPDALRWFAVILLGALAILGARASWRLKTSSSLVLTWALLPLALAFLISLRRPIYVDRFLILTLPAFWLLIANGLNSMHGRMRAATGALVVALMAYGIATFVFGPAQVKEDWRTAAATLRQARSDEALMVRTLQMVVPLAYYHPDYERFKAIEVNRDITPISELAAEGAGSWLLYWSPTSDAHSVSASTGLNIESDSNTEVVSWITGHGPRILHRTDLPGLIVLHFDKLPP